MHGGGTNGGSDTGGGTATCPTGGGTFNWVGSALEVGNASEGVDLDGDGAVDNVFSLAARSRNDDIATALADGSTVLVMQFWNIEDWCDDGSFQGGILIATDLDGNGADNYSGSETFDPGTNVDSSGHAVQHASATVSGSNYSVTIPGAELSIGGVDITTATPILIEGTANETENSGHFGFGIAVTDLVPYAEANGIDPSLLYSLADLDTDGDGVGDAISAGFVFDSVSCGLR